MYTSVVAGTAAVSWVWRPAYDCPTTNLLLCQWQWPVCGCCSTTGSSRQSEHILAETHIAMFQLCIMLVCIVVCMDVLCAGAAMCHDVLARWRVLLVLFTQRAVCTKCSAAVTDGDGVQIECHGGTQCAGSTADQAKAALRITQLATTCASIASSHALP